MKLLLLCQTQEDVNALPAAAAKVRGAGITHLWVSCSPAIGMDTTKANAEKDTEINALEKAEKDAAYRGDYDAAKEFRTRKEAAVLDKQTAIAEAWKNDPDLTNRQKEIFQKFVAKINDGTAPPIAIKVSKVADHYQVSNWVNMINSIRSSWASDFVHGDYTLTWVSSFAKNGSAPKGEIHFDAEALVSRAEAAAAKIKPKPAKPKAEVPKYYTGEELETMKHFGFMAVAKKYGVYNKDEPKLETIKRILDKQVIAKQAA